MGEMDDHDHDLGLAHDLKMLMSRRTMVGGLAASGALAACQDVFSFGREPDVAGLGAEGERCIAQPGSTAGPFPADGSNRAHGTLANVLDDSGIVRRDIRTDVGGGPDSAGPGAAFDVTLRLVDVSRACAPLQGYVLYLWHCDADGLYSIYQVRDKSYFRGVAISDGEGWVRFTTIVPGCYPGRYPHFHFEVYPAVEKATDYRERILTSQLAVPQSVIDPLYEKSSIYSQSLEHMKLTPSFERDVIFARNSAVQRSSQMLDVHGSPGDGYSGAGMIGVNLGA